MNVLIGTLNETPVSYFFLLGSHRPPNNLFERFALPTVMRDLQGLYCSFRLMTGYNGQSFRARG